MAPSKAGLTYTPNIKYLRYRRRRATITVTMVIGVPAFKNSIKDIG